MLLTQLKYDLKMFFREIFYMVFTIILPPLSYAFLGQLFAGNSYYGMNYAQFYTPSFIVLITFAVIFFAFGFENVMNRSEGIEKRISIAPINIKVLVISNILKSIIITTMGFVLILMIGVVMYNLEVTSIQLIKSYLVFILVNVTVLILSLGCYSFFKEMKSALVFSIVLFQVVMFTGDFSMSVASMPKFVQYIAKVNPMYHLNHLFINVWNNKFAFNKENLTALGYIGALIIVSLMFFQINSRKKRG